MPSLRIYGVVARSAETQAAVAKDLPNAKIFADYQTALNDPQVELVVVATPSGEHKQQAIAALLKGA